MCIEIRIEIEIGGVCVSVGVWSWCLGEVLLIIEGRVRGGDGLWL